MHLQSWHRCRCICHPIRQSNEKDWFTVWNSNIVNKYNGEKKQVIAMRPYLDEVFSVEVQKQMITLFDTRSFTYRNVITFKQFQSNMELLKPRK